MQRSGWSQQKGVTSVRSLKRGGATHRGWSLDPPLVGQLPLPPNPPSPSRGTTTASASPLIGTHPAAGPRPRGPHPKGHVPQRGHTPKGHAHGARPWGPHPWGFSPCPQTLRAGGCAGGGRAPQSTSSTVGFPPPHGEHQAPPKTPHPPHPYLGTRPRPPFCFLAPPEGLMGRGAVPSGGGTWGGPSSMGSLEATGLNASKGENFTGLGGTQEGVSGGAASAHGAPSPPLEAPTPPILHGPPLLLLHPLGALPDSLSPKHPKPSPHCPHSLSVPPGWDRLSPPHNTPQHCPLHHLGAHPETPIPKPPTPSAPCAPVPDGGAGAAVEAAWGAHLGLEGEPLLDALQHRGGHVGEALRVWGCHWGYPGRARGPPWGCAPLPGRPGWRSR